MTPKQAVLKAAEICEAMNYTTKYHFDPSGQWCGGATAATRNCVEALRAFAETLESEQEGWKLVPVEPTKDMLDAGDLFFTNASFVSVSPAQCRAIYRAMLAAAPSREGKEGR